MKRNAVIDSSGAYRYSLIRSFDTGKEKAVFIMLNPSTADAMQDDPTIRRCIDFAKTWGYKELEVVNLFAFRATEPKVLFQSADPIGPENDAWLRKSASSAGIVVAAWGMHGQHFQRDRSVLQLLSGINVHCLGRTKKGYPRHPLYVPASTKPQRFVF